MAFGVNLVDACKAERIALTTLQRWRKGAVTPRLETTEKVLRRIQAMGVAAGAGR